MLSLENRQGVPGDLSTQARNNGQRVLRGCQHDDVAIREEPEVPVITKSAVIYTTHNQTTIKIKHPPVVLNVVPSPVESIQRFLSLTNVWRLADIDTCENIMYEKVKMQCYNNIKLMHTYKSSIN